MNYTTTQDMTHYPPLLLKICGMRESANILDIAELKPDLMGFIFYESSPRYVGEDFRIPPMDSNIKRVGVFVNHSKEYIIDKVNSYNLDIVQLHGDESPDFCQEILNEGISVMKAFPVHDYLPLRDMNNYVQCCDCFLLDTKTEAFGGSGRSFNWEILQNYLFKKPFFLSGGIGIDSLNALLKLDHPQLIGIDLNSKFEITPGVKDAYLILKFMQETKST